MAMSRVVVCPNCVEVNHIDPDKPLRQQFCWLCQWALELDHPEDYGLTNNEPYDCPKCSE